jgi:hypothetical protein
MGYHLLPTLEYGMELAYAKHGKLEEYIKAHSEPQESLKRNWILSLTETLSYVYSRRVLWLISLSSTS